MVEFKQFYCIYCLFFLSFACYCDGPEQWWSVCDGIVSFHSMIFFVAGCRGFFFVLQCLWLLPPEGVGIGLHWDMGADFSLTCTGRKGLKVALDFLFYLSPWGFFFLIPQNKTYFLKCELLRGLPPFTFTCYDLKLADLKQWELVHKQYSSLSVNWGGGGCPTVLSCTDNIRKIKNKNNWKQQTQQSSLWGLLPQPNWGINDICSTKNWTNNSSTTIEVL